MFRYDWRSNIHFIFYDINDGLEDITCQNHVNNFSYIGLNQTYALKLWDYREILNFLEIILISSSSQLRGLKNK